MDGLIGEERLFAPHVRDGKFFCPWGAPRRGAIDLLRWQLGRVPARRRVPAGEIPRVANDGASLNRVASRPELTWIGHSSFALHCGESVALLDPHFGPRALVPARWSAPGFPVGAVPPGALALLSHNHYDHLDRWTAARLPKSLAWRVPLGLGGYLRGFGFSDVRELDWGDETTWRDWRLTFVPVQHWSRRLSQPENTTLWGGWMIDTGRVRLFFCGDSGWFGGFGALGRRFGPIDCALLPIGAYEPRWFMNVAHMSPEEALRAFVALGAGFMVPTHWGAFDLADEAVDEPPRALARALATPEFAALGPRVRPLAVGERIELESR